MKIFLFFLMSIVSIYWGCTHFEVAYDNAKEGNSFWPALASGMIFFLFGGTCFVMWIISLFGSLILT